MYNVYLDMPSGCKSIAKPFDTAEQAEKQFDTLYKQIKDVKLEGVHIIISWKDEEGNHTDVKRSLVS